VGLLHNTDLQRTGIIDKAAFARPFAFRAAQRSAMLAA
jgi:hypothetical protein